MGSVDFPPLFSQGFHPLSLSEITEKCVEAFPFSKTRKSIVAGLEEIVRLLEQSGVNGDLWVDGSFATKKIDPSDADVVLACEGSDYDKGSLDYRCAVDFLISNLKDTLLCETFVLFSYPKNHELYTEYLWNKSFYIGKWGWSDGLEAKGIIKIHINGKVS